MFFNTSPAGTGKGIWSNKVTWCTLRDRVQALALFGGQANSALAWVHNQHAANNPWIDHDILSGSIIPVLDRTNLVFTLHDPAAPVDAQVASALLAAKFTQVKDARTRTKRLMSGEFFYNNNEGFICSSRLLADKRQLVKAPIWFESSEFLVIFDEWSDSSCHMALAFARYEVLAQDRIVWDGFPLIALEGYTYPPEAYLTPAIRPVPDTSVAARELNRQANEVGSVLTSVIDSIKSTDLLKIARTLPKAGSAVYHDILDMTMSTFISEYDALLTAGDNALVASLLEQLRKHEKIRLMTLEKDPGHEIDPYSVTVQKQMLSFEDAAGEVQTIPHSPLSVLLNSNMCIVDSVNSFIYTSADGRGLGARGVSNMVYRQLNRYTFSEVVWNHATDPNSEAFPHDPKQILSGDFHVDCAAEPNAQGNPMLDLRAWYTSRYSNRGTNHLLADRRDDEMYIIDSVSRGRSGRLCVIKRESDGAILDVKRASSVITLRSSEEVLI